VSVRDGAAAEHQGSEVDEAVTGRNESRHVVKPVHVDPEPTSEDVLHDRRVDHDDADLDLRRARLATQQHEQEQPGPCAQQPLLEQGRARVEPQHDDHPDAHHGGDPEVVGARHRVTIPRRR
jgi:hypothetical protein